MTVLLDTAAFLWFVSSQRGLSETSLGIIVNAGNTVLLSHVSIWEAAIKFNIGKLDLIPPPFSVWIDRELAANSFKLLEIKVAHLKRYAELPLHHRDPFDRLIIAQSMVEDIPVLTSDRMFDRYDVDRIW